MINLTLSVGPNNTDTSNNTTLVVAPSNHKQLQQLYATMTAPTEMVVIRKNTIENTVDLEPLQAPASLHK